MRAQAMALLDSWAAQLTPPVFRTRERAEALQRGDTARATHLEPQALRVFRAVETFGLEARQRFADQLSGGKPPTLVDAVVDAGDRLSRLAYAIRAAAPLSFREARKIADIEEQAMGLMIRAYSEVDAAVPPPFRIRP